MNNLKNKIFKKKKLRLFDLRELAEKYEKRSIYSVAKYESTLIEIHVARDDRFDFEENPIIFNGSGKTIDEIKIALERGAKAFTLI